MTLENKISAVEVIFSILLSNYAKNKDLTIQTDEKFNPMSL